MRKDGKPRYREAYPRLDVLRAAAAHRRGRDICVFRDDHRRILGLVRFAPQKDSVAAELTGYLHGPWLSLWRDGPRRIEFLESRNQPLEMRRAANCPACGARVQALVYVTRWGCAKCHRLSYRRQLVDRRTLDAEDLQRAMERLKQPRPKNMHQRKFAARRVADEATVERLRPLLGDPWRRVASAAHQTRVDGVWMSPAELRNDRDLAELYWNIFDQPGGPG